MTTVNSPVGMPEDGDGCRSIVFTCLGMAVITILIIIAKLLGA